jgi:hypothetical protein
MDKIPTAEEIFKRDSIFYQFEEGDPEYLIDKEDFKIAMIEFAKLHVKEALKAASNNAYVEYIDLLTQEKFDYTDVITDDGVGADVNKQSILNAYPEINII